MMLWIAPMALGFLACVLSAILIMRLLNARDSAHRPGVTVGSDSKMRVVSPLWRNALLVACVGFAAFAGTGVYSYYGRPDLVAPRTATFDATNVAAPVAGDVDDKIAALAGRLLKHPDDVDGWRLLGWSYFNTQRFDESAGAYGRAVALDPANGDLQSLQAEAVVQAAGGQVTPAALTRFQAVLARDPKEFRSRFYVALSRQQAGQMTEALDLWQGLLADAPSDAGWRADVVANINDLSTRVGQSLVKPVIPQLSAVTTSSSVQHSAAVSEMIAKLAAKIDTNPQDRDGWAMMIRSLAVTGDMEGARRALAKAMLAFTNDRSTGMQIEAMAASLGVIAEVPADETASQSDQQTLIRSMVDGLASRLASSPHDEEGWVRLIRSRMVLNEPDLAREALRQALVEFSRDAESARRISTTARSLGVAND